MAEIKRNSVTKAKFTKEELSKILTNSLGIDGDNIESVKVTELYSTEEIPGLDPHDADYIDIWEGIEIEIVEKQS